MLTKYFEEDIKESAFLLRLKAWSSILVFLSYGYILFKQKLLFDIMFSILLIYIIGRNSKAFIGSVKLAKLQANLSIASANIFQIIIAYGTLYRCIYFYIPGSFRFEVIPSSGLVQYFDFIYFSFVTFTTLGYGDIVPTNIVSKALVMTEIALFLILITIAIIFISRRNNEEK